MLLAEFGDDIGARGVLVAENAGQVGGGADLGHELFAEGVALGREIAPVEPDRRAGDLPMARRRVLAA
jgi:hypothetical protein